MSTDVVVFRTQRIVARLGTPNRRGAGSGAMPPTDRQPPSPIVEVDTQPGIADAAADRIAAARARWSQLTFYLFDPASWR